ncbi:NAD(P)-dependent oxidoreductase [Actinomadura sp. DC4]|uniref:2-hydroxyacid dehydrogenase n=1 Tax=Actinomadura sp. DC4 TaxID=3055069 RepID=UPI0025B0D343|nr:NAD(P)-dependent oxidoreductase [Actinomadura sp. DC4]MDN3354509.1 NAD(P)-dependent oxidoreductase [Actinomadura sp. DC4]
MSVKIVILDEVEFSDRHRERLDSLGEVTGYSEGPCGIEEVVARSADADVVIVGWTVLDGEVFRRLPRLRMISVWATGHDSVDVGAAARHGVTIANVPAYAGRAVAELTIGLLLALTRHLVTADRSIRSGEYTWRGFEGIELAGRTLGLVGIGDIGSEVARLAGTFGMRVLACARTMSGRRAGDLGVEFRPLGALLAESDVVSLHTPLSPATRGLIGRRELAAMRAGAYLINTARAGLVDQRALADALCDGHLAGAALDDIHYPDDRLTSAPGVLLTPHIGFNTTEALRRKGDTCVANVAAFLGGTPTNVVNPR